MRSIASIVELLKTAGRLPGFVHQTAPVTINGKKGFLVWEYILWNDVFFVSEDKKICQSFLTSFSDKKTEERFRELVSKYGIQPSDR